MTTLPQYRVEAAQAARDKVEASIQYDLYMDWDTEEETGFIEFMTCAAPQVMLRLALKGAYLSHELKPGYTGATDSTTLSMLMARYRSETTKIKKVEELKPAA
ncbi:MAG: hypothetical protein SH820_14915 [Xanthomonadales bacterium]|nr:hypothetical protein [Xanthomonadales bacterium]